MGTFLTEGKTKKIFRGDTKGTAIVVSKDTITAGDGARWDTIPGKGRLANRTTCNVFRLLKVCGLPVAFEQQDTESSFVAPACTMLPYEVVTRREAHGSYLKRHPHIEKGQLFPSLIVEFYLKTKDKNWKGKPLVADDPLMLFADGDRVVGLLNPAKPLVGQAPFLGLSTEEIFTQENEWRFFPEMRRIARQTFLILEKAWQLEGGTLVDLKVEFGVDTKGNLLLADVIDNDSWRVVEDGSYIDKQVYRDGGALDEVERKYMRVADITDRFRLPKQRIIFWRGSDKDELAPFHAVYKDVGGFDVKEVTCSIHKEPVNGVNTLHRLVQEIPDCVVIAYIGRSNGAGPVLSAMSTVPVITVPALDKGSFEDVWSSLRTPSKVPVMTVMEPSNAVLAALQILSARNPLIYAHVRSEIETRMVNSITIP